MKSGSFLKLGGLLVAAAALLSAGVAQAAPLTQCPAVGASTSCAVLYTFNKDGSVSTTVDTTIASTDGIEDTLAGVLNLTGHSINSITLSGVGIYSTPLFSFDGDGYSSIPNPGTGAGDSYFGQYFASDNTLLGTTSFSAISIDQMTGTIDFAGLTDGGSGWFVLEDQISFTAPPTVVPEPASLALLGIGLAGLAAARRRRQAT